MKASLALLSQDKLDHRDSVPEHEKRLWKTKQKTTHNQAQINPPTSLKLREATTAVTQLQGKPRVYSPRP